MLRRSVAKALISVVGAVAALGLATGVAHADGPGESPIDVWSNYEWCPGDPIPQADAPITWDMKSCHIWHYQSMRDGAPSLWHVVEGRQASQCPPLAFMCP
jgi:hypothetical protein